MKWVAFPETWNIFPCLQTNKEKRFETVRAFIFFAKKMSIFHFIPNLSKINEFKNLSGIHQHLIDGIEIPHQISNTPLLSAL